MALRITATSLSSPLGDDYAFEMTWLRSYRDLTDGLTSFECKAEANWSEEDHNPQCRFAFRFLNVTVFEFEIYNVWHVDRSLDDA